MKYEDSAQIDTQIATAVGDAQRAKGAPGWLSEPVLTSPMTVVGATLEADLARRAAKLRAFSTAPTARNLAGELDAAAEELRSALKLIAVAQDKQTIYRLASAVGAGFHALTQGCYSVRQACALPVALRAQPEGLPDKAPPPRGVGRPRAPTPFDKYAGEPWFKYMPRKGPGRPAKNEIPWTEERAVAHAKNEYRKEQFREQSAANEKSRIVRRVVRKPEERL